jgi:anti-sigma factor RsiW
MIHSHLDDAAQIDCALGDGSPEELRQRQEHLSECAACERAVARVQQLLAAARGSAAAEPSVRGLTRLLTHAGTLRPEAAARAPGLAWRVAVAAGMAILVFGAGSWHGRRTAHGAVQRPGPPPRAAAVRPLPPPPRLTVEVSAMPRATDFVDGTPAPNPVRSRPDTARIERR